MFLAITEYVIAKKAKTEAKNVISQKTQKVFTGLLQYNPNFVIKINSGFDFGDVAFVSTTNFNTIWSYNK